MRGKTAGWTADSASIAGFNEAPAECGGKPRSALHVETDPASFNEAPAECGGKRYVVAMPNELEARLQ